MTTEVAVMNKTGIALAADSAVTIGGDKVYNTVNKLFTLSKYNPVGVMVYGTSTIMGVPWETVIKLYRRKLADRHFENLNQYAYDFLHFLENDPDLFSEEMRNNFIVDTARGLSERLLNELTSRLEQQDITKENFLNKAVSETQDLIDKFDSVLTDSCSYETNKDSIEDIVKDHGQNFRAVAEQSLERVYQSLPESYAKKLDYIFSKYLFTEHILNQSSGLVVAGFGEKDLFPKVVSIEIEGIFLNRSKSTISGDASFRVSDDEFRASILPFAQSDMIHTFLSGIDPNIEKIYKDEIDTFSDSMQERILNEVNLDNREEAENTIDKIKEEEVEQLTKRFKDKQGEHYINDVVNMLNALPKDELAEMADTLVNLIAFKKKVTKDTESVGGPIDVALITKGDGFVWIKRKHYFDPNLNHHFFKNYYIQ